jgi:hypothetical protein
VDASNKRFTVDHNRCIRLRGNRRRARLGRDGPRHQLHRHYRPA